MNTKGYIGERIGNIVIIALGFLLIASNAWAGGFEVGYVVFGTLGLIAGVVFAFKIHPVLGILTALGAISYMMSGEFLPH